MTEEQRKTLDAVEQYGHIEHEGEGWRFIPREGCGYMNGQTGETAESLARSLYTAMKERGLV